MPPRGSWLGRGWTFSPPTRFAEAAAVTIPDRGSWGCHRSPAAENRGTAVCCPVPGSSQPPAAAPQPARHPALARVMNGHGGSKTYCKWEFPLFLKKVPTLPGNLSREGDVFHARGVEILRAASASATVRGGGKAWMPLARTGTGSPRSHLAPLAKLPPFPRVSSTSKHGRKNHLMQTKVV